MLRQLSRATLVAFVLGALLGAGWPMARECLADGEGELIDPDCARAARDRQLHGQMGALEGSLRAALAQKKSMTNSVAASVTFRDLESGVSFSIDGDSQFAPASLLKLPFAFVIFVMEEDQPGFLDQELRYAREDVTQYEVPVQQEVAPTGLVPGNRYTVETLLKHVIVESDNLAYYLLLQHLMAQPTGPARFERTLRELGVRDPANLGDEVASTREYATLFKRLYAVSYLDAEASRTLLSWLDQGTFDSGLSASVPKDVRVANKFGERIFPDGTQELHDCGIVYHPTRPYVLCVMTKGRDVEALRRTLAQVSHETYAAVDAAAQ